jgi:hypothetical protein
MTDHSALFNEGYAIMRTTILSAVLSLLVACKGEAPVAEILSPTEGQEFLLGDAVTFTAELSDDRSPVGFLNPVWSSNIQGELAGTRTFDGSQTSLAVLEVIEGTHTVTLTLTDPEDNVGQDTVTFTVLPNPAPTITFTSPEDGAQFALQETNRVEVAVMFEDANEGELHELQLTWGGDIDGVDNLPANPYGNGEASITIGDLEAKDYTISVTATDSYGDTASAEISFTVFDADADGDGYASPDYGGSDCDDDNDAINPAATEVCDGVDNNCDNVIDEPSARDATTWYADADGDGYGDASDSTVACDAPPQTSETAGDCDDAEPASFPTNPEVCDGIDNNCDNVADEDDVCNVVLADARDALFLGESTNDAAGSAVALAGDVNGDGDDDFFIGAPFVADSYTRQGAAYLVFGPVSGEKELEFANLSRAGTDSYQEVGGAVAGGVDVDGDGYDDLLMAAPGDSSNATAAGSVELIMGGPTLSDIGTSDTLMGIEAGAYAGTSVLLAVALDGVTGEAVVVGSPYEGDDSEGAVYVVNTSGEGDRVLDDAAAVAIRGGAGDIFGLALAAADTDGDGRGDLVASAPGDANDAGIVYLFQTLSGSDLDSSDADAQLVGAASGDAVGFAMDAGDFNGDGYSDLAVGAPLESGNGDYSGAVYLFLGPISGSRSVASADSVLRGLDDEDYAGWSLALADADGDGNADLFVGAPEARGALAASGVVYTVWGGLASGSVALDEVEPKLLGNGSEEFAGESLDAGDVDGDGKDDLLIGAAGERTNGSGAGGAYLLLGGGF